jgi:hypothetical protein
MTQSYDPSKYHEVTWRITSPKAAPRAANGFILGPFNVTSFVFCSTRPDQWAQPGFNTLTIDLQPLGLGTPWTVSASVTELSPPGTPTTGAATFETLGAQLNQPGQQAVVYCNLDWPQPLPVAVTLTIGHT